MPVSKVLTGVLLPFFSRKAKDVAFMNKLQQKHYMKLGTKANKLQRHFVDPNK